MVKRNETGGATNDTYEIRRRGCGYCLDDVSGSFGPREGAKYLGLFGLEDKVSIADSELSNAVKALKNGQTNEITTTSLPVVAYSSTKMDEDAAYALDQNLLGNTRKQGQGCAVVGRCLR